MRTWIHDNLCCLTIKSDTGQHSQFLRCLLIKIDLKVVIPEQALPKSWHVQKVKINYLFLFLLQLPFWSLSIDGGAFFSLLVVTTPSTNSEITIQPIPHKNIFAQLPKRWANETEQPYPPLQKYSYLWIRGWCCDNQLWGKGSSVFGQTSKEYCKFQWTIYGTDQEI